MYINYILVSVSFFNRAQFLIWPFAIIFLLSLLSLPLAGTFTDPDTSRVFMQFLIADPYTTIYNNIAAGEFTPGKGFQIVKNDLASLNISIYASARWLNQLANDTTWVDHQGRVQQFDGRN